MRELRAAGLTLALLLTACAVKMGSLEIEPRFTIEIDAGPLGSVCVGCYATEAEDIDSP